MSTIDVLVRNSKVASVGRRVLERVSPYQAAQIDWRHRRSRGDLARRVIDRLDLVGKVAIDVGANEGLFSARFQHLVGPHGHVHAIEPLPFHAPRLEALARRGNLRVTVAAASDQEGELTLHVPVVDGAERTGLSSLRPVQGIADHHPYVVPVTTVDRVLDSERREIGLLKIDVEGHEQAVLAGASSVLGSRPPLFVEIEQRHLESPIGETFDSLLGLGYSGWGIGRDELVPLERFSVERDQLAFLRAGFQEGMPAAYVNDFLFLEAGVAPPEGVAVRT